MARIPFDKFVTRPALPFDDHIRSIIDQYPDRMRWHSSDDVRWTWPDGGVGGYVLRYSLADRMFTCEHMRLSQRAAPPPISAGPQLYALDVPTQMTDEITALFRATLSERDLAFCAAASIRFAAGTWRR